MKSANFDVTGMSCGSCVRHVEEALRRVPGVNGHNVTVGSADVSFDPAKTSFAAIAAAIAEAGYAARERADDVADRLACRTEAGHGGGCCCG